MDEHSNDSSGENDLKYSGMGDGKGSLRSVNDGSKCLSSAHYKRATMPFFWSTIAADNNQSNIRFSSNNDDDIDNSIHSHTAPPFLMSSENKLFSTPGSFNFSMAALADPATLAGRRYLFGCFLHFHFFFIVIKNNNNF